MADLKAQATFGDTTEPSRKIPFVEKQRRLTEQEGRITGFSHRNEQQPSHALIDACFTIVETGALIYLPPSKCGSRDAEIHTDSKNKQKQILTLEQGGRWHGTEAHVCLPKEGLAFGLVNLVSWDVHTAWTNKLYRALMSEPPPGFGHVSLTQILRADQELFTVLAAEFQQPLKASAVGAKPPLDDEIKKFMMDPRSNVFLAPLPKSEHKSSIDPAIKNKFEKKPLQPKLDGNKASPQIPAELQGLHLKTKDNKPLCWHKNLQKGHLFSQEAEETDMSDPVGHPTEDNGRATIHNSALVLEIFAGSCRLSRTCRDIGFRATAVEKDKQRAENFSIFACDVTKQEDAKQLMDYTEAERYRVCLWDCLQQNALQAGDISKSSLVGDKHHVGLVALFELKKKVFDHFFDILLPKGGMPEPDRQLLKEKTSKHDVYRANSGDGDCSWMARLNKSTIETFHLLEARRLFYFFNWVVFCR
ncbi:unnamed protein product [Cladocopium goreaui]|uniref:Uncharacterized protein n=1 Tax=Cladocopium goreaui TaxID=2562237 RepID=A0A9P1CC66_9DINO|nr:unnamed protein product [Cladocopium goreaui]